MPKQKMTRLTLEVPTTYYLEIKEVANANIINPITFIEQMICSAAIECAKLDGAKQILKPDGNFKDEDLETCRLMSMPASPAGK